MQLIRPAATIVLARDSLKGPEVLMVKRSTNSAFGDLHVFPGGTLDPEDYLSEIYQMSDDLDDQSASSMLKVEKDGLAYMIAVVRECFEEVGILMSKSLPASLDPKALKNIRDQINNKKLTFYDFCLSNDIHFDFTNIVPISHWITPEVEKKRFDTRFFFAKTDESQQNDHDGWELTESVWIKPSDALKANSEGTFNMIMPTIKNLSLLLPYKTVADAFAGLKDGVDNIQSILPKFFKRDGNWIGLLPDDEGYEDA